ncbi:PaaI family thioesterase [Nocardiopsis changdeensis]|uniref:PaaI family thioesterase n=1 Tax=Nocardiopsis changdeensis TaxID=2831969 RepID=A0ABX8BJL7_9ACTN|nr:MULTISPECIES: PaaI family thioesterase [Nocardiopsis]QUX21126.1 PaaI family thioesterase [Nocardiopsis changdeensis]QYX37055.1 PaaI family thioesterase [Nocardiopsis sp. MT53]
MTDSTPAPGAWGEPREKTVTWYDPKVVAAGREGLTGAGHLRAMAGGELPPPPIAALMGFDLVSVGEGEIVFTGTPDDSVYNPLGIVHGGYVCTLLDTVAGCAVQTTLPAGSGYTSIEIKVNYLRPVTAGTTLTARGWVPKPGRRVAFAEGDVRDESGKVVATASSTCLVFDL